MQDGFVDIDKRKAFFIDGRFTLNTTDPPMEMKLRQYYFFGRDRKLIYVATFTGLASKFEAAIKATEEAAKSFRVD